MNPHIGLEGELTGKLHDSCIAISGHLPKQARRRGSIHRLNVGMVRRVECLRAELECQSFLDAEITEDAGIQSTEAGAVDGAASRGSWNRTVRRRSRERTSVEPRTRRRFVVLVVNLHAVPAVWVSDLVWPQAGVRVSQHAQPGIVRLVAAIRLVVEYAVRSIRQVVLDQRPAARRNRKRQPGVRHIDTRQFPSAQQMTFQSLLIAEEWLLEYSIHTEHQLAIHGSASVVAVDVVDVLNEPRIVRLRVGKAARPGKVRVDVGISGEALRYLRLQRVVVRAEDATQRIDCEIAEIGLDLVQNAIASRIHECRSCSSWNHAARTRCLW